jgi:phage protein D
MFIIFADLTRREKQHFRSILYVTYAKRNVCRKKVKKQQTNQTKKKEQKNKKKQKNKIKQTLFID